MPYVHLSTNVAISDTLQQELFAEIGKIMPLLPGKTWQNTMIHLSGAQPMVLGDAAPCLHLEARLYKPAPEENKQAFVKAVGALLSDKLGVSLNRMYINIIEFDTWGSGNGIK